MTCISKPSPLYIDKSLIPAPPMSMIGLVSTCQTCLVRALTKTGRVVVSMENVLEKATVARCSPLSELETATRTFQPSTSIRSALVIVRLRLSVVRPMAASASF
jgi:hypothetical protein